MIDFEGLELASMREAYKLGIIDNLNVHDDCVVGYSGKNQCFAMAFTDEGIDHAMDLINDEYPLYFFRGTELAKRFIDKYPNMDGVGHFEYVYRGGFKDVPEGDYKIKVLDPSFLDVVEEHYKVTDRAYIEKRLVSGCLLGIFDDYDNLMGFIGEHFEGAMGMLEVFPEYRRRGYGEILEMYKINQLLEKGRTPLCNVFYDNAVSPILQEKLGLEKCAYDTWWVSRKDS